METVLITGGTGLVGTALTKALTAKNFRVIILTRNPSAQKPSEGVAYAAWKVNAGSIDEKAIASADHIVHLAGANVAEGWWTEKRKKEIIDSRVKSAELLVTSLKKFPNKVQSVISASAIGYYGSDPQIPNPKPFVETDAPDRDFLASVVRKWEAAIQPVIDLGKRLVILRTGIVMANEGGAYKEFQKTMKFGVATILANGKQVQSWIHINDLVNLYIESIQNKNLHGIFNAVAPVPADNKTIIKTIVAARSKKYLVMHVPAFVLKAVLGEMSVEVLKSTTVSSRKIESQGFIFQFPTIGDAVRSLEKA